MADSDAERVPSIFGLHMNHIRRGVLHREENMGAALHTHQRENMAIIMADWRVRALRSDISYISLDKLRYTETV